MQIQDRVYGEITIEEPIIVELINSKPFQRLKHISQDGASHFIQPERNVTRFEHCIGSWYLSARFNRPIGEQIASLLHDLPHTAFSHVIDFVVRDKNHEYHDGFTEEIIINSEIPEILKKHDITLDEVLKKEGYVLLTNNLPDISVDRWDYFLRDSVNLNLINRHLINAFMEGIYEKDEKFYFKDVGLASEFAILFMNASRLLWLDPSSHGAFFLLSEAIKIGLEQEILTHDDIFSTDDAVWKKLENSGNEAVLTYLNRLQPGKLFHYVPKEAAEFYGPNKPRFVDPWVEKDGALVHLSDILVNFKDYFKEFKAQYANLGVKQD